MKIEIEEDLDSLEFGEVGRGFVFEFEGERFLGRLGCFHLGDIKEIYFRLDEPIKLARSGFVEPQYIDDILEDLGASASNLYQTFRNTQEQ